MVLTEVRMCTHDSRPISVRKDFLVKDHKFGVSFSAPFFVLVIVIRYSHFII